MKDLKRKNINQGLLNKKKMASKGIEALAAERTESDTQKERNDMIAKITLALDKATKQEQIRKDMEQDENGKEREDEQETEQYETIIGKTHRKVSMCLCAYLCRCPCACPWQSSTSICS